MRLKADFYHVQQQGDGFVALVFQGSNVIEEILAVSEKQAHYLAREEYPEARTPAEENARWRAEYDSPEGRAWRRRNPSK